MNYELKQEIFSKDHQFEDLVIFNCISGFARLNENYILEVAFILRTVSLKYSVLQVIAHWKSVKSSDDLEF